jgi:DNA-binding SARP family transcriptional activator
MERLSATDPPESGTVAEERFRIQLLGQFRLSCGERLLIDDSWTRRKAKALVKLLALHHPRPLHREQLLEALWPEADATAAASSFRQALFRLRATLADQGIDRDLIEVRGDLVQLCPATEIDAAEFKAASSLALASADVSAFEQAISLYRGELLPGDVYEQWTDKERSSVSTAYSSVLRSAASAHLAHGRPIEALKHLEDLLFLDELDERSHRMTMLARYRCGQKHAAVRQYDSCRELLRQHLGTEPSAETENLYRRILADDISLEAAQVAPPHELVGRAYECERLQKMLDEAALGRGRALLLSGEPGIGKSRLAQEAAARAAGRGLAVLWGRCYEGEGAPAYWPWKQVVTQLVTTSPMDYSPQTIAILAELVPEVAPSGTAEQAPALPPEQARFRLMDAIVSVLRERARRQPLLIVLEDIHGADTSSLSLLQMLARQMAGSRIAVLATARDVASPRNHPLIATLAELARESHFERLPLSGLSGDQTRELLQSLLQTEVSNDLAAAVHERTEGNPFFITELAASLPAGGVAGDLEGAARSTLPSTVRSAVLARVNTLSSDCFRLLTLASVVGRRFKLPIIAQAAGVAISLALVALDEALSLGVLESAPNDPQGLVFAHALIAATLYEAIPSAERPKLHFTMAEAMAELATDDETAAEIAHHYLQSARAGGDARKALEYSMLAANVATRMTAYEEAVRQLELALEMANTLQDQGALIDVLIELGLALKRAGEVERSNERLEEAVQLARAAHDRVRLSRAAIALSPSTWYGQATARNWRPEFLVLLREVADAWGQDDDALHVTLRSRLGIGLYLDGAVDEAAAEVAIAEEMARRLDDIEVLSIALVAEYVTLQRADDPLERRRTIASELFVLSQLTRSVEHEFQARIWQYATGIEAGDPANLEAILTELRFIAERTKLPHMKWTATILTAGNLMYRGSFSEGLAMALEASRMGDQFGYPTEFVYMGTHYPQHLRFTSNTSELSDFYVSVFLRHTPLDALRADIARSYIDAGDHDSARPEYAYFAENRFQNISHNEAWLYLLTGLAEISLPLGSDQDRRDLIARLAPHADRCVALTEGVVWWGSVSHYLGMLHSSLGECETAGKYFDHALQVHSRMAAKPFVALTEFEYGRMLLSAGENRPRALELIGCARATAEELGMTPILNKIGELGAFSA